jgi:hypothetical protein
VSLALLGWAGGLSLAAVFGITAAHLFIGALAGGALCTGGALAMVGSFALGRPRDGRRPDVV